MRRGYVIALIVCVVTAGICGCQHPSPTNPGKLDAKVVTYRREEDVVLATVAFTMPSLPRITPATAPWLRLRFQTRGGWKDGTPASFGGRFFWQLQPGSTNCLTLALPTGTVRWRLSLTLRESGWRDWFIHRLSLGGWWARDSNGRIRSFWPYVARRVPNVAGMTMFFESKIFSTQGLHKSPQKRRADMWVGIGAGNEPMHVQKASGSTRSS